MITSPTFVKLGGSVLTDKTTPEAVALATLAEVARTLAEVVRASSMPVLVGHGGGSFGHYWAERYATSQGITHAESWWGVVRVADAMARLNRTVVGALIDAGLPALGVQPSASAQASGGRLHAIAHQPLMTLLDAGVVPVVYGDVILDDQQGCAIISTEGIFTALASLLKPTRMILVGEEAVFDADPRTNPAARPIPEITPANYAAVLEHLSGSHGVDVTGGMRSKVAAMWALSQAAPNLEIVICGPSMLASALRGAPLDQGTIIKSSSKINGIDLT